MTLPSQAPRIVVLHLEDNPRDRELIAEALRDDGLICEFIYARDEQEFLTGLARQGLDLILCDYTLPSYNGAAALEAAKDICPEVPLIYVSGTIGEDRAVESFRLGATDYVIKDRLDRLAPVVRRALREGELRRAQTRTEKVLRQTAEIQRSLIKALPLGVDIIDSCGRIVFANERIRDLVQGDPVGRFCWETYPNCKKPCLDCFLRRPLAPGREDCRDVVSKFDGRTFLVSHSVLDNADGPAVLRVFHDVTEKNRVEQELLNLNRIHTIQSNINQTIVRVRDRQKLLDEACRIAVEDGQLGLAAICSPVGGGIRIDSISGECRSHLETPRVSVTDDDLGRGTIGTALREGIHCICNDIAQDERMLPWRDGALAAGLASVASFPIRSEGEVIAALVLFARTPGYFDSAQIHLLLEVAEDLSFALEYLQKEERRKKAESELKEKERALSTLLGNLPGMAYRCGNDENWTMEFISEGCLALTGFEPKDFVGNRRVSFNDIVHPEDRARVRKTIDAALISGDRFQVTYRIITAKGSQRWVHEQGLGVYANDGSIEALEGFIADITERKQADEARRESEQRWKLLFEHAPDAHFLYNLEGVFISANRAAEEFTGLRREAALGKAFSEFNLSDESGLQIAKANLARNKQGMPTGPDELQLYHQDGSVRTVELRTYPLQIQGETLVLGVARDITDQKKVEQALRLSEDRFRSVWEDSIDGMRLTDAEGRIVAVNAAYCRLTNLKRQDLVGQLFSVAYASNAGDPNGPAEYHRRFTTGEIVPRLSTAARLWDQRWVDLEISNSFVSSRQGGKWLLSIFRDVTEQKRAEERVTAFSSLGHRLSAARTAKEAGQIIFDIARQLLGWDACSFMLYSRIEDLADRIINVDTIDGQVVEATETGQVAPPSEFARRILEQGGQLVLKSVTQRLDGAKPFGDRMRPSASIISVPVRWESEPIGVVAIHSYTPNAYDQRSLETLQALADHCAGAIFRIRTREDLEKTRVRLDNLVSQSPVVIFLLTLKDGAISSVWLSDYVQNMLGYSSREVSHLEWWVNRAHPQDAPGLDDMLKLVAAKQLSRDYRIRHKDGEYRWIHEEQRVIFDTNGLPVEVVGSWMDNTERKTLEDQLRHSQKMDAVGQLAGGIAHDFNNLIAIMRGNTELAMMIGENLSPKVREYLKHVTTASERAAGLTRQLLAFGRKQVMQPQPLQINDVISNLTKMLNRVIGENIALECRLAGTLPFVNADVGMIEQVLVNLVVNARDAMPNGGKLVISTTHATIDNGYVRTHLEARAGEFVRFSISDTGTGIEPEVLPRIFEPFFTTKAVGKGTGLGLAMVYGIVRQHEGWVEVQSEVGKGTTFTVSIPITKSTPRPALQDKASIKRGTEKILLVEDDFALRTLTERLLETFGYKVSKAASAKEALAVWDEGFNPDLLLTDIMMPDSINGRELAAIMSAKKPGLKVVFMSGYSADIAGKETDFLTRKSFFLQKPCPSHVILETVRKCLDE